VTGATFWRAVDRVCAASKNICWWEDVQGAPEITLLPAGGRRVPTAYDGIFKAVVKSAAVKTDIHSRLREARFNIVLMTEPKWEDFFYFQKPKLIIARDDKGWTWTREPWMSGYYLNRWHKARDLAFFDGETSCIRLVGLPELSTKFATLSIEVPVKTSGEGIERRFENVLSASESMRRELGDISLTLSKTETSDKKLSARVRVHTTDILDRGTFTFSFEHKHGKVGRTEIIRTTYHRAQPHDFEWAWFHLAVKVTGKNLLDKPLDLVVTFVPKPTTRKLRFDFKNISLP